jgi:hypothetical protein
METLIINPKNFTYQIIYNYNTKDTMYTITDKKEIQYWIENYSGYYNLVRTKSKEM